MKILFISHSLVVESYRKKIEIMKRKSQHEILLIVADKWKEAGRIIKANPNGFIALRTLRLKNYHGATFLYSFKILSIIRKFRPDIIHVEEEHYSLALFQIIILSKVFHPNCKIVFQTWQNIFKKYLFPFNFIEWFNLKYSSSALVGSKDGKEILLKKEFNKKIVLIQMGVNISDFEKERKPSKNKVIAFIGRFGAEKAIDILLSAVSDLTFDFELWLVGNGECYQSLEKLIKELSLTKRTKIFTDILHHQIPELLSKIDVLVLPSITTPRVKEQFGRVLIEAMAAGVPVIGSDSGAIPEVIGDAGLTFKEGDALSLRKELVHLFSNKKIWKTLSLKGKERVEHFFTVERVVEKTLQYYQELKNDLNIKKNYSS